MAVEKRQPELTNYLSSKAAAMRIPLSGTFELTARCNMDCKMCYVRLSEEQVRARGRERTEQEWLSVAREALDAGTLFLLLTGGEPFILPYFKSLYTELSSMGFMLNLNSNGVLVDEKTVDWLSKVQPSRMSVTLYGGSEETYDKLCGNGRAFPNVIKAIRLLKEAGILLRVTMTLTPYNLNDYERVRDICDELDVPLHMTSYVFPPLRRDETRVGWGERLSPEDAGKYVVEAERSRLGEEKFAALARYRLNQTDIRSVDEPDDCEREYKDPLFCRAGKSAFWINWQGIMTPCGMMNFPTAKPFENGFKAAWESIVSETQKIYMPHKCVSCEKRRSCAVCGASVYCETGKFGQIPEYICTMANATKNATQDVYNAICNQTLA